METKNIALAVVLSFIVLAGWQLVDNFRINGDWLDFNRPALVTQNQQANNQENIIPAQQGQLGDSNLTPNQIEQAANQSHQGILQQGFADQQRIRIANSRLTGSINLQGARIDDLTLLDYRQTLDDESPNVHFLFPSNLPNGYFVEFGWVAPNDMKVGDMKVALPNKKTVWQVEGHSNQIALSPDSPLSLTWENPQGVVFKQIISMDENFLFSVVQDIDGGSVLSDGDISRLSTYGRIMRRGIPQDLSQLYILHEGLVGYLNDGLEEIDYDDLVDSSESQKIWQSTGGWIGITDKYWLSALIPTQDKAFQARTLSIPGTGAHPDNLNLYAYQSDILVPLTGTSQETKLFLGAKQTTLLDEYRDGYNIQNFDLAVDFGWFYFLTKPIYFALHWLNEATGNFGVAILLLTVLIKLLLFPLANKSYHSMSKMKLLQPKMMELRERYQDDRTKLNQAMMDLYKTEKVNPLAGCLPIVVQIPIFFSLYKVLYVTIEMRHAPFFGWIHDLSAPDPLGILNLFGLVSWDIPGILVLVNIGIWPILMGISMWAQMRLNPTPSDPIQQKIFTYMPIVFTFMLANFAAGLVIYWTWNNVLSMAQQYVIMKRMGVAIGGGRDKPAKKA